MQLSEIRKTLITGTGLIVSVGTLVLEGTTGFLSPQLALLISSVVGIATVALNYLSPNETSDPARVIGRSVRLQNTRPLLSTVPGAQVREPEDPGV